MTTCVLVSGSSGLTAAIAGPKVALRERFARTAEITNTSWGLGKMFSLGSRFGCWLRDRAFSPFH